MRQNYQIVLGTTKPFRWGYLVKTTEARPAVTVLQLCRRKGTTAGGAEDNLLLYSEFSTPFDSFLPFH